MVLYPFTNKDINIDSKSIHISNGLYKNTNSFSLIKLNTIESIEIGNDCFSNANLFKIDGLNHLKSIKIGNNSFTENRNSWENNSNRSFHILNCIKLESIEIGEYSFSDYGGGFELKNLPKLSSIKIGEIGSDSYNFRYSSFVIKGIIDIVIANE